MPNFYSYLRYVFALVICVSVVAGPASAAETDADGRRYEPSENPIADVQQALVRAEEDGRLTLVVLGGNWCHDSRALAARFYEPPMAELIEQNYELVFVDAGFLANGRDVMQQFGVSNYYATPTVLIVDSASGQVINNEDRHQWSNAYKMSMSTSVEYFEKWQEGELTAEAEASSAELRRLYAEIDEFELQQADRVSAGYAIVGPMLEQTVGGDRPEEFDASWDELAAFRIVIPDDILELRAEARSRVAAGEQDIQLEYPDYPSLSWEAE